jgi:nicotinate phosphoribosyltransferase
VKVVVNTSISHIYLQSFQSFGVRLRDFQKAALEDWVQEYRGDLGTALTDVVGMDAFLADFDLYFAKLFDGLRHDSGDPVEWGEKALAHYARLRIDAHTRRLVFSDSLDMPKAFALYRYARSSIMALLSERVRDPAVVHNCALMLLPIEANRYG